jgi:hypothetical protein
MPDAFDALIDRLAERLVDAVVAKLDDWLAQGRARDSAPEAYQL